MAAVQPEGLLEDEFGIASAAKSVAMELAWKECSSIPFYLVKYCKVRRNVIDASVETVRGSACENILKQAREGLACQMMQPAKGQEDVQMLCSYYGRTAEYSSNAG